MMDLFNYSRRESSVVHVGATPLGGNNPIRLQSMTNTSTMDTEGCVEQAKRIIEAGGEYVRLTTQGTREAENLQYKNGILKVDGDGMLRIYSANGALVQLANVKKGANVNLSNLKSGLYIVNMGDKTIKLTK